MPLDGFAVNHKASGSLDMRFLTTKRGNFHASKCPKGDDFRGTLIEQALHLAKAPPFTDISIKMRALSVNLNEVLPQITVMHHCIYQKRPARSASLFA